MLSFQNTCLAFANKTNFQLLRAKWLFRFISFPILVKVSSVKLRFALKLGLPVSWILKPTVFAHFCGGEDMHSCDKVINTMGQSGVKTILDYAAEGKESETEFENATIQVIATIRKAQNHAHIPFAVFKPSGVARVALLEKVQSGATLSEDEKSEFANAKDRFHRICMAAKDCGVPVMIDAEESWIQEVVDTIAEECIMLHNKEFPLVFTTLQMYRTDRLDYLKNLHTRARTHGIFVAVKLVRGAYMEKERNRAMLMGYPSPILPDKVATDASFDAAVKYCLQNINDVSVSIATHNENSCLFAVETVSQLGIKPDNKHISFSQLLGMSDHISYNLAAEGFIVTKYVPFGPVKTVVPYLIRRAEENTSVEGQTSRELSLITQELKNRKTRK
ncbi:MAG TPA: proline dehydrogenase [Bacteroidales bacterium]|nr:proline dehydrogenase [Bacteroidales bacterium]